MTQTKVFSIEGMSCQNCVRHVRRALEAEPGITVTDVSIGAATVSFDPEKTPEDRIAAALAEAGYPTRPAA